MAVTDVLSLDEFVDLYKILEVPSSASEPQLRERVNKLYLEAQRNLDHHNFRKRFYYQQLYEVHLPQAHQLLLHAPQRAEYDLFLDAFNKGLPFPTPGSGAGGTPAMGELGRSDRIDTEMLPSATPTPTPAADKGGKTTFNFAPEPPPSPAKPATRPAKPATRPAVSPTARTSSSAAAAAAGAAKEAEPSFKKSDDPLSRLSAPPSMDASEVERRRDYKRRELIKRELVQAGMTWGLGSSVGAFAVLSLLLLAISSILGSQPLGMAKTTFVLIGILVVAGASAAVGRVALRARRRHIVVFLSKMPYDELLRRCAR